MSLGALLSYARPYRYSVWPRLRGHNLIPLWVTNGHRAVPVNKMNGRRAVCGPVAKALGLRKVYIAAQKGE
jgi:hypothetical protein